MRNAPIPHYHFKSQVTGTPGPFGNSVTSVAEFHTFTTYGEAVHAMVTSLRDDLHESPFGADLVDLTHGYIPDRWVRALREVVMVPQSHHLPGDTMPVQGEYRAYACQGTDCK
jgi:hypothetical protein